MSSFSHAFQLIVGCGLHNKHFAKIWRALGNIIKIFMQNTGL